MKTKRALWSANPLERVFLTARYYKSGLIILILSIKKHYGLSSAPKKPPRKANATAAEEPNLLKAQLLRSIDYQEWLLEKLKDHDEAVAYLNAALEESLKGDEESQALFLVALRNVAEAQGGVGNLAKKAGIGSESLYKTLSDKGNPKWHTLVSLVIALGLNLILT